MISSLIFILLAYLTTNALCKSLKSNSLFKNLTILALNQTYDVVWKSGGEGFYSLLLQLKTLNFITNSSQIRRNIYMDNFNAAHYHQGKQRIRMCDYIAMPHNIRCGSYDNGKNSGLSLHAIEKDIRSLNRPRNVHIAGVPGWWNMTIHKAPVMKVVVAPFAPRLRFHDHFYAVADIIKQYYLKIPMDYANGLYIAVHWRRGDQLTTRCVRTAGMVDRSLNCANVSTFISHLKFIQNNYTRFYQHELQNNKIKKVPVVVLTNENDTAVRQELSNHGFLVSPQKITHIISSYLLQKNLSPSNDSAIPSDIMAKVESFVHQIVRKLSNEVVDLVIDSILMIHAIDFYSFGGSFVHDSIDSERMLQGRSFCIDDTVHSFGSFCDVYFRTLHEENASLLRRSLQEYWKYFLQFPPARFTNSTTAWEKLSATMKLLAMNGNFSQSKYRGKLK